MDRQAGWNNTVKTDRAMKQFNLKEALEGKSVITREGKEVKIAGYSKSAPEIYRIAGYVNGVFRQWYEHGGYFREIPCNLDLFMN